VSPRTFVRDWMGLAFATYVARAVVLARGLVAAAVLGPAGFGAWNALSLVLDYGAFASAGSIEGLDLRLPVAEAAGRREEARRLVAGAWAVVGSMFACFALAVVAIVLFRVPGLTAAGPGPALLMLAAAGAQLAMQVHASAARARGGFTAVSRATAVQALIGGGLGLALVARLGLWALAGGWLCGSLVALALLRSATADLPWAPMPSGTALGLVRAGLPVFGCFLASLVLRSVDRLAMVHAGATESLGLYALGLTAAGLVLYPPESAAAVLYPRIAAAAGGARDLERTRAEVVRVHRALSVVLPLAVALGLVWVGPVVAHGLPRYAGGIRAVRLLAFGALLLSAATVPGYWMLGRGRAWTLLTVSAACAALTAVLVFAVAARSPRPVPVAVAACVGYGAFAVVLVLTAVPDLVPDARERVAFVFAGFLPPAWAGASAFAVCALGPVAPVGPALLRSAAVILLYLPVLAAFGRRAGLREALDSWRASRTGVSA
jgi:O-antigen/teichoic acid export membrane protein